VSGEDVCGAVFLHFYTGAGVRKQHNLPEARGVQFTDELADDGRAAYTAPLLAQAFSVDPDLLEDGICKAALVLGAGEAPTEVFAWELMPTSGTLVGELADEDVQCMTPGLRHLLAYMPVRPEGGAFAADMPDARTFGWMSTAYSDAAWSTPIDEGITLSPSWPSKLAKWICADLTPAVGDILLARASFTLTAATNVRFDYAGDDTVAFYVDGVQRSTAEAGGYPVAFDVPLGAGSHQIAVTVTNLYPTQCKLLCTVMSLTSAGKPDKVLLNTDLTHWKVKKVTSSTTVSMTAGAIFRQLLSEAQTAGDYGASLLTTDFTDTVDSAGTSWPDIQSRTFPVGSTSLADVVRELEDVAFDLRIKPDGTVQAWVAQGSDVSSTVWFKPGVNLLGMTYQGSPVRATIAWVRSDAGWAEVQNSTAISTYGKRYIGITSGVSASVAQGSQVGSGALSNYSRPQYVYTAQIRAVTGAVPFRDFKVGDTVKAPARGGAMTSLRVLSITASSPTDAAGPVTFSVELDIP
jgi:hypothetical protein